jgi:hypothetical protein
MYTPINRHKLSAEGRKVFDMVERYIVDCSKINATTRHITLSPNQYNLLIDGLNPTYLKYVDEGIPFGEFIIVRAK